MGHGFDVDSFWENIVAEWCRISIFEVLELELDDFLAFRRDAFINKLSQTEKGNEYLKKAWMFEQTKPDRAGLRNLQKKLGGS